MTTKVKKYSEYRIRAERVASPEIRRERILKAAFIQSIDIGYMLITRDAVAEIADISSALIAYYFPKMSDLKEAVVSAAIEQRILAIVMQALSINDPLTKGISNELRQQVAKFISK